MSPRQTHTHSQSDGVCPLLQKKIELTEKKKKKKKRNSVTSI